MVQRFNKLAGLVLLSALLWTPITHAQQEEKEDEESWTDDLSVSAFVDSHVAVTSEKNSEAVDAPHRAYVRRNGFSLNFVGVDLNYDTGNYGATVSLRMGPGRAYFLGRDQVQDGDGAGSGGATLADNVLGIVNEAYVTWRPTTALTFDLGQFSTIYGAEVTESWQNLNYTRGALYYLMQPFWHTGLRANYQITDKFALNGLVVNGANNSYDFNRAPSLGLQAALTLDNLSLYAGWLGALKPNQGDEADALFDHFIDVVANVNVGDFSLVGNFDLGLLMEAESYYYGVSLASGYSFTDWFGTAARVEFLGDPDGAAGLATGDEKLLTFTGTMDFKPVTGRANLVLRPEFRLDKMLETNGFVDRDGAPSDTWWTVVLGAVVHSG